MPKDFLPIGLELFSDGSTYLSTFVMYLISSLSPGQGASSPKESNICQAQAKSKHHSVPCNEAIGTVLAVEALFTYLMNHWTSLTASCSPVIFPVNIGIDSECFLYSLNPNILHTSVLIRNATRKFTSFALT